MKQVIQWYLKAKKREITCSDVVDLIANQEYATGHPHMHLDDGFELDFTGTTLSVPDQLKKKGDWSGAAHLYPVATNRLFLIKKQAMGRVTPSPGDNLVFIDEGMLPKDDSYLKRTGEAAVVGQSAVYGTKRIPVMDKTTKLQKTNLDGSLMWVSDGSGGDKRITDKTNIITPEVKAKSATIPHSMFEDGESAVMTLTAVLNSKAGQKALNELMAAKKIVIFSHTGVDALHAAHTDSGGTSIHKYRNEQFKMLEMRYRPATGDHINTPIDIEHVVTVLKRNKFNELILTTHYPCANPPENVASSGVTTGRHDLVEIPTSIGKKIVGFALDHPLPPIAW